jgi:phosphatidylglycerophosphatase A
MNADSGTVAPGVSDASSSSVAAQRKPRLALFIATACGLGYIPVAPGTWGSLAGLAIALFLVWLGVRRFLLTSDLPGTFWTAGFLPSYGQMAITVVIGLIGVWAAHRSARFANSKDPQFIVIDEVSGQLLTYFMPFTLLNWKYWLLGFILFRVFDIWKPFPARQAESLPGGWGIMADDWVAGIYAAIGLWLARAAGL